MKFYLIDDDQNVVDILSMIIEERSLGEVCGQAGNGVDALDDLEHVSPDIVIVDLLMPVMDGVELVKRAKRLYPSILFIMLSQVLSKGMVASAYESGIEFFIQKPVNALEVERVVSQVTQKITMQRAFGKMQSLFESMTPAADGKAVIASGAPKLQKPRHREILENVLLRLGIAGESGSRDIAALIDSLVASGQTPDIAPLSELCAQLGQNPKSVEQRVRRAAFAGMVNLASLGIEDYSNDIFVEYASTLYNFEQVKKEMDCIRGKTEEHGKVFVKSFLSALLAYCQRR